MKQRITNILTRNHTIALPFIRSTDGRETLQKWMTIQVDSVNVVDRQVSIVDWIAVKGGSEVWIGLSDGWLQLTGEQRERIESSGKSFMIWRTDLIDDWVTAVATGQQNRQIELPYIGMVTEELQVAYWVYHSKWGWQNGAQ